MQNVSNKVSTRIRHFTASAMLAAAMLAGGGLATPAHALDVTFGDLVVSVFGNSQEYFRVLGNGDTLTSGPTQSFDLSAVLPTLAGSNDLRYSLFSFSDTGALKTSSSIPWADFTPAQMGGTAPGTTFNTGAFWVGSAPNTLGGTNEVTVPTADAMSFISTFTNSGTMAGGFPVSQEGKLGSLLHFIASDALGSFAPRGMGQALLSQNGILQVGAQVGASPVPLPAAVWLFGTGLISLVGLARRSSMIKAA